MIKDEFDSKYEPGEMFPLSRLNYYNESSCINLSFEQLISREQPLVGLNLHVAGNDVCYPLTENDIDALIEELLLKKQKLIEKRYQGEVDVIKDDDIELRFIQHIPYDSFRIIHRDRMVDVTGMKVVSDKEYESAFWFLDDVRNLIKQSDTYITSIVRNNHCLIVYIEVLKQYDIADNEGKFKFIKALVGRELFEQ
jgi:hypothetical protein|nr:MAG TPA: hypothetical protein [Bacteriophage sp.]DAS29291.1 MAG TPA: hypothetical protein [Caudoviricetes sp.]